MRDLNIVQITISPVQYNPVRQVAVLNEEVNFSVHFDGGSGAFVTSQALNPFESFNSQVLFETAVLNGDQLLNNVLHVTPGSSFGAELIIITDPTFLSAANDLADWKREKGIVTKVVQSGPSSAGGIGVSRNSIKAFLQDRWDNDRIRPSYVLLLGDAEFIPPWYRSTQGSATTGTDLDYSLLSGNDLLADVGLARISADTAEEAQTVIDKIIQYEKFPPASSPDFYRSISIPSYFQCCREDGRRGRSSRGFIETAEFIRDGLLKKGYLVDRLYYSDTSYHPDYSKDETPRRYRYGWKLPEEIGPDSGFFWDAGQTDLIDMFEDGRFLVIHRDHGGPLEWTSPTFTTGTLVATKNQNLLPVLFSVNCASGLFDNETAGGDYNTNATSIYLLERFLRKDNGGAVGALGDTRNSPTWANNALARGFSDAVFPSLIPGYGDSTSVRRLADILNYGKLYMFTQVGMLQLGDVVFQATDASDNNILWHAFGDPTQEIWTQEPEHLPQIYTMENLNDALLVSYETEGATITATQNGMPIGRASVVNGQARLTFTGAPDPLKPIQISASKANAISRRLTPPTPTGGPDLMVSLSGIVAILGGNDIAGDIIVEVSNTGDEPAPGNVDDNGDPTNIGYAIDIVLSTDTVVPEGFAGIPNGSFHEDRLLVGGRISRTPQIPAGQTITLSSDPPISSDIGGVIPPLGTPPGSYFLCARIDPGDRVAETDENNNVDCIPLEVLEN